MTPRPMYMQIPVEEYESLKVAIETMAAELEELRKHEVEWDLDKARVKELEAENESLKYSVATLDTDLTMLKRWRKVSEELPEKDGDYLVMARYPDDKEKHIEICFYDSCGEDFGHWEQRYVGLGSGDSFGGFDGEEWITHNVTHWMPLPEPQEVK